MRVATLLGFVLLTAAHAGAGKRAAVLDLSRPDAPLFLVQTIGGNVWEYSHDAISKVNADGWGTAFVRASHERRPHVSIQAFWYVRDGEGPEALGAVFAGVEKLVARYGLSVVVPAGEPKVVRKLKAGTEKVAVYGVDLLAHTRSKRKRRVYVYAFQVNGSIASLVVSHVGESRRSSEFRDGFTLTRKPPSRAARAAQFSCGVDYRVAVALPGKGFRRVYDREPGEWLGTWHAPRNETKLRITASRSVGKFERMVSAWSKANSTGGTTPHLEPLQAKGSECYLAEVAGDPRRHALIQRNGVFLIVSLESADPKTRDRLLPRIASRLDAWMLDGA